MKFSPGRASLARLMHLFGWWQGFFNELLRQLWNTGQPLSQFLAAPVESLGPTGRAAGISRALLSPGPVAEPPQQQRLARISRQSLLQRLRCVEAAPRRRSQGGGQRLCARAPSSGSLASEAAEARQWR